jgi:hypothetical protein
MYVRRLYEALITSMPEGNFDMEFKTAVWNLTIFLIVFTLENKIQDERRSPQKEGTIAWFHLIGYHQRYHPDCCRSGNHQHNILQRHPLSSLARGEHRELQKNPNILKKNL